MRITVFGASGGVGGAVAALLAETNHTLRVVTRDESKLSTRVRARAEMAIGSALDGRFAAEAAEGSDALFWMTPMALGTDIAAFNTLAAASAGAAARRTARVVDLSGAYCERPNFGLASHIRVVERAIEESAENCTHLRAGLFMSNFMMQSDALRAGIVTFPVPGHIAARFVAPEDIARAAVGELLHTATPNGPRVKLVVGPERLSFAETAKIIGEETALPLKYVEQDENGLAQLVAAGWPAEFVREYGAMYRAFARAFADGDEGTIERVVGATSLRSYARTVMRPRLSAGTP